MDLARVAIDLELAQDGVWHTFWEPPAGSAEARIRFRIARAGVDHTVEMGRATAELPDEVGFAARASKTGPVVAKLVRDWTGVQRRDEATGELVDVPYSREEAARLCTDPRFERLIVWIVEKARTPSAYGAILGNSESASIGPSASEARGS